MSLFFSNEKIIVPESSSMDIPAPVNSKFYSIAAAMLDRAMNALHLNHEVWSRILQRHFLYFPQHKINEIEFSPKFDPIKHLMNQFSLSELIETLAYTLRQLALDEMMKHPTLHYEAIFSRIHHQSQLEALRDAKTPLDKCIFYALAKVIHLDIMVQVSVTGQELPTPPYIYPHDLNDAHHSLIILEQEEGHYKPRLKNPSLLPDISEQSLSILKPNASNVMELYGINDIQRILEQERKNRLFEFEHVHTCLLAMWEAKEITKTDLLNVFVQLKPSSTCSSDFQPSTHSHLRSHAEEMIYHWIQAIAIAVSYHEYNQDDLFEQLEKKAYSSNSIVAI